STSYQNWPIFSQMILFVLCFVGGCAGSAGGGPKVIRIAVVYKLGADSIKKRLHPNAVTNIKVGSDTIAPETVYGISGFIGLYLVTFALSVIVISLTGQDLVTCISSCILTLGNIGIGLGGIGMDFSFSVYPNWALWVFSFLMLIGRLELFTVFALFTRDFWIN
ncbi:MAG: TrkH family potassium uptake protein, partial [Spirochaetales bacterium]|nr:TrkH family potassium uptake protein [Candidatus Physcosoma equi]